MEHDLAGVSWTAVGVALCRAMESRRADRLFDDPLAVEFVAATVGHGPFTVPPAGATPSSPGVPGFARMLTDYVAVRTRYFDRVFAQAMADGVRQVVLVGAGLDARAYRLDWPAGLRLFELDVPGMVRFKESVLAGRPAGCERITVPIDLREDWPSALTAAGFRAGEPAVWLAEGLLPYLHSDQAALLLDRVTALAAPGSRLALEHGNRNVRESAAFQRVSAEMIRYLDFAGLWVGGLRQDPIAALAERGWTGGGETPQDLAARFGRVAAPVYDDPAVGAGGLMVSAHR